MRGVFACLVAALLLCVARDAGAQSEPAQQNSPGFEVVRSHIDFEVRQDGTFLESSETAYRVLDERGQRLLQQTTLSYTQGYETLRVAYAYTLKADGQRIDVPQSSMLEGHGSTSMPGFQDVHTLTIIFPNVEIGDQVVLVIVHEQTQPWFAGQFAAAFTMSRTVVEHDVRISMTSPAAYSLNIDAAGLEGGAPETFGDKIRRTWTYQNDTPISVEQDAVNETFDWPHLFATSFPNFGAVATATGDRFQGKADATPEIRSLADNLTKGMTDKREKARVLYEWVSSHIAYVNILLGAGGYTPHAAADVLASKFGDCKDHVMLLQAMLSAEGIDSSPVLINLQRTYELPTAASPFLFDHLITYIPEFDMFLDSTAQYAAFGSLPFNDAGKPVLVVASGKVAQTPIENPADAAIHVTGTAKFAEDGSYEGDAQITASGAFATEIRALMNALPANGDGTYLRLVFGPGADGTVTRGDVKSLSSTYVFSVHYRMASVVNFPGPGALPSRIGFAPFSFTFLIGGNLPPTRSTSYSCTSLTATESLKIELPPGVAITSLPKPVELHSEGASLTQTFSQADKDSIVQETSLRMQHPQEFCTSDYYARERPQLARMVSALRAQVLYQ